MSSNALLAAYINPPLFAFYFPTSSVRFPSSLSLSLFYIHRVYTMPVNARFILLLAFVHASAFAAAVPLDSRRVSDTVIEDGN